MIDHASDVPMWCSDTSTGLLMDANDVALRFWGYERDVFIGMPAVRMLSPEELRTQKKMSKRAVKGQTGPWKCLRADGSTVYVIVRWTRTNADGQTIDLVVLHSSGAEPGSLQRFVASKKAEAEVASAVPAAGRASSQ